MSASDNLTSKEIIKLQSNIQDRINNGKFNKEPDIIIATTSTPKKIKLPKTWRIQEHSDLRSDRDQ